MAGICQEYNRVCLRSFDGITLPDLALGRLWVWLWVQHSPTMQFVASFCATRTEVRTVKVTSVGSIIVLLWSSTLGPPQHLQDSWKGTAAPQQASVACTGTFSSSAYSIWSTSLCSLRASSHHEHSKSTELGQKLMLRKIGIIHVVKLSSIVTKQWNCIL
jgi:hypothetical protein